MSHVFAWPKWGSSIRWSISWTPSCPHLWKWEAEQRPKKLHPSGIALRRGMGRESPPCAGGSGCDKTCHKSIQNHKERRWGDVRKGNDSSMSLYCIQELLQDPRAASGFTRRDGRQTQMKMKLWKCFKPWFPFRKHTDFLWCSGVVYQHERLIWNNDFWILWHLSFIKSNQPSQVLVSSVL